MGRKARPKSVRGEMRGVTEPRWLWDEIDWLRSLEEDVDAG